MSGRNLMVVVAMVTVLDWLTNHAIKGVLAAAVSHIDPMWAIGTVGAILGISVLAVVCSTER